MPRSALVLLGLLGLAAVAVLLKFGTLDPCGIVRAEIRQQAVREGQFAQVLAAVVPDSVIDAMIAIQYGNLTPGRCIALAFSGAPPPPATAPSLPPQAAAPEKQPGVPQGSATPQDANLALRQASDEARTAIAACRNKRLSGELKTYAASAECSNPQIVAAYQKAGYRYMDLIYLITAKRRELAEQIDLGKLTETQEESEFAKFMARIGGEQRQREREQR